KYYYQSGSSSAAGAEGSEGSAPDPTVPVVTATAETPVGVLSAPGPVAPPASGIKGTGHGRGPVTLPGDGRSTEAGGGGGDGRNGS
ncbi:MAG: hypothetical protein ACRD0J_07925, partial [Acidimicrobiales bacterium]